MTFNFKKFSEQQAELDLFINAEKQINHTKYVEEKKLAFSVELGELYNENPKIFKYWSNKQNNPDKAIIEYADGLCFLLSIANVLKVENYEPRELPKWNVKDLYFGLQNMIAMVDEVPYIEKAQKNIKQLLDHYLLLGEQLGFTPEEIERAYNDKCAINYERQTEGY